MSFVDIIVPADSQEGTKMVVQSWAKKIGNSVAANEPLVELETDKVMMEIEAPVDGVLVEILCEIGAEIEPGFVIGRVSTDSKQHQEPQPTEVKESIEEKAQAPDTQTIQPNGKKNSALSPSVRRFVMANKLNVAQIVGTGRKGRITLENAKKHLASLSVVSNDIGVKSPTQTQAQLGTTRIPHTGMRRSIAKHMHDSVITAPHVTAVFEADFTSIAAHRDAHKAEFAKQGVKLSYTAYMIAACVEAMKAVPQVNSQWHDDFVEIFSDINIGVGTSLENKGLIVPVIKNTQDMTLFDIAKNLQSIIDRARENNLKLDDVRQGTFTISNHGVSGSLLATPIIINQPQSAILGVGKLEKRAVVKTVGDTDMIAIRPMAYVSLTVDHRVLDGHQTNTWLSVFVNTLENWKE